MKIASLGIAVALGAAPLVAHAQVTVSGGISFNLGAVPGQPVTSLDVFYDQLAPYGVWVDDPIVGQVFIPDQPNYVPYTNGHWELTDVGFVWVSSEPFAWATTHYGRWFYSDDYGRWVWVPDTTWGPSWVDWYEAGDDFGWAPLAPDIVLQAGYSTPYWAYRFAPARYILSDDIDRYYVPRDRVERIRREARPIAYREQAHGHQVIVGPQPRALEQHRIQAQPRRVEARTVGRMNESELRAAEQRARTRRPQIEQQNAKRLEAHTQIRRAAETRATRAPANRPSNVERNRNEPNRPSNVERNRNEPNRPSRPEENRATPNPTAPNRTTPPEDNRTRPGAPSSTRGDGNRAQPNATPTDRTQERTPARPEPKATPAPVDRGAGRPERTPGRASDRGNVNVSPEPRPEPRMPERPSPSTTPTPSRPEPRPEATPSRPEPTAPRPEPRATRPEPTMPRAEPRATPTTPRPEPRATPTPPRAEPRATPTPPRAEPRATPTPPRPEPRATPTPPRPEPHAAPSRPPPAPHAAPSGHAGGHGGNRTDHH